MDILLDQYQKKAISQFLDHISSSTSMMKWDRERLFSCFESYCLPRNCKLDYSLYVRSLKSIPFAVKRDFICNILNAWEFAANSDYYTLYQTIQDILYLKIETGVECVMLNNILNVLKYFGNTTPVFEANVESGYYLIDLYLDMLELDYSDTQIRFTTSSENEIPRVEYGISENLLREKMNFIDCPSQDDVTELLHYLTENKTQSHCPWIYLNYQLGCCYTGGFGAHLRIEYSNIQYIDNNG